MLRAAIAVLASLWTFTAAALESCPAAINSGTWDTWLAGIGTGQVTGGNFLNFVQSQPASARGEANIDASACDGSFVLQMPNHRFIMEAADPDSAGAAQEFTGNTDGQGMNWSMTLQRLSDSQLAGGFEAATTTAGISISVGVTGLGMQYQANLAAARPECTCREQLEAWIANRISEADAYSAAWADGYLRLRPADWPVQSAFFETWGPKTHKRMVDMVVAGYSSELAAEVIWNNTTRDGEPIGNDFAVADGLGGQTGNSATGETPEEGEEYVSLTAAYVDDDCQIHVGDAHEGECYPDIALEATMEHEGVHVLQCNTPMQRIGGLIGQANREADAYTRETVFWENWIPQNCD